MTYRDIQVTYRDIQHPQNSMTVLRDFDKYTKVIFYGKEKNSKKEY